MLLTKDHLMPYPLIFATNGDMFARLNPDLSWSVRWQRTLDVAYAKPHPRQVAVQAYAKLLMAAKDNFFPTPWEDSEKLGDWSHFEAIIDYIDVDVPVGSMQSSIMQNLELLAKVNYDGTWSVRWDKVLEYARLDGSNYRAIALIGVCRLLRSAKDRFVVTPWVDDECGDLEC
jgi:hypothetical protein